MSEGSAADATVTITETSPWRSEDVWAIWLGGIVLAAALAATWWARPADEERLARLRAIETAARAAGIADSPTTNS